MVFALFIDLKNGGDIMKEQNATQCLTIKRILEDFTKSYTEKESDLYDLKLGFLIDDNEWWHIYIKSSGEYEVNKGKPQEPVYYFIGSMDILQKIHKQEMTAMTAMGRAQWSDPTPLDIRQMEGAKFPDGFNHLKFAFRYFNLSNPEMVKLGKEHSRIVHDGYAIPLVYNKGLRSGWYRIDKGMQINEDPKDQVNPFDTVIIVTEGKGVAKLGGKEIQISKRETYYIPEGMSHTFWTDDEEGLEFIIIMYGEKA